MLAYLSHPAIFFGVWSLIHSGLKDKAQCQGVRCIGRSAFSDDFGIKVIAKLISLPGAAPGHQAAQRGVLSVSWQSYCTQQKETLEHPFQLEEEKDFVSQ